MRLISLKIIAILSLLILSSTVSRADVIAAKDTVTGTVIGKNKEPLPGAKVEIVGQPYSAFTDLDGRFNLKCDHGAKDILVSYPKAPIVKRRIKPDMTVRVGRTWRDAPEHYQWFVGANVGVGVTSLFINDIRTNSSTRFDIHHSFVVPTISIMGGRVKDVGWYAKAFMTPGSGYSGAYYSGYTPEGFSDDYCNAKTFGAIIGGMIRMNSPLHFYLGVGLASTDIYGVPDDQFRKLNWQLDFGFLYRIKDHFGVNLSFNAGVNNMFNYVAGSYGNLGVSYFFNK